jgi:hypothetical protein
MIRTFLAAVVLAAPIAHAQAGVPTTPTQALPQQPQPPPPPPQQQQPAPRAVAPATRPSPLQLHEQAVAFMREEKFDKATPLLNRAFNETPPAQRSRPLILNRALLDLVQRTNLMRGIKELNQYFTRNPAPDEQASNILGSLLELAAENTKWREGPIYAEAFREFARREAVLERHREGFKRWGPKWITQAEFDEIKAKDRELMEQITAEADAVNRLRATFATLSEQYERAATQARGFSNHMHVRRYNDPVVINPRPCAACEALRVAQESVLDLNADLKAADGELRRASSRFATLQSRVTKPQWPRRYDPIPVDAPPPAPPQHPAIAALDAADEQAAGATTKPAAAAARDAARSALPPASRPSDLPLR